MWFRGNLSGWEGWFNYPPISREDHVKGVEKFILAHPDLFRDGDIFSGCPECENGSADGGDPRRSGDVNGYRRFLINEFQVFSGDFARMGKNVAVISSMNLDVAKLVMDKPTTSALGSLVAVDHYATSTSEFESDLSALHAASGGKIILGEFGGPIPDINGRMDDAGQADLVRGLLDVMHRHADFIVGANYWTLRSGSSALVTDSLDRKPALGVLADYFSAPYVSGTVKDDAGKAVPDHAFVVRTNASSSGQYAFETDAAGGYHLFVPQGSGLDATLQGLGLGGRGSLALTDPSGVYATTTMPNAGIALKNAIAADVTVKRIHVGLIQKLLEYLRELL